MFQYTAGSVRGKEHFLDGKNNQDAFCIESQGGMTVVIVSDGCGDSSSPYSEVGARIGSRLTAHSVLALASRALSMPAPKNSSYLLSESLWETVRQDVLSQLRILARWMGTSMTEVVRNHFLFTTMGALITEDVSVFFGLGDGVVIVNGEEKAISFPDNKPPYIGYGLVSSTLDLELEHSSYTIHQAVWTRDLESFVIATDGISDLMGSAERMMPGTTQLVGPISQLWTNSSFFANPDNLRRWLARANRDGQKMDWEERVARKYHGLLHDDTTIVVGRRKMAEEGDA